MCHSPSKEGPCTAKALLRRLLVNPPSLTTDLPPLQSVPLTMTVQVKDIRVHLFVETVAANHDDTASEELGHTLGMIYLTSLQVHGASLYSLGLPVLNGCYLIACEHHSNLLAHPKELENKFLSWPVSSHETRFQILAAHCAATTPACHVSSAVAHMRSHADVGGSTQVVRVICSHRVHSPGSQPY